MATYQLPEVLGVVGVDEVAQLMDHHIISDGMGCLDNIFLIRVHVTTHRGGI
jgi:hypothetical protein